MIRVALALAFLGVMTTEAAADPASLLIAGFNALAGTTLTTGSALLVAGSTTILTVGQAISATLFIGLGVAASMFKQGVNPSRAKETFSTEASDELRAVGRVRIGGLKVFGNTSGVDRYRLVAHLKGPIAAIETTYLGGREVIVESDGSVSSPPYGKSSGSYVWIWSKLGTGGETAWSQLTTAFPDLWTSAHRLRGIAQSLIKYVSPGVTSALFGRLYSGGVPDVEHVVRAEKVYDPRDTGQSATDAATWEWSDNGILCATHVMRSFPEITADDIDWTYTATEATRADATVTTKTGTEKRARCWGVWSSEEARGDLLVKVLDSIGAEVIETDDGKIAVSFIDDARTSDLTIPARHLVSWSLEAGPESVERPNICQVRYYSPERNYELAEIDMTGIAWARIDDEIAASGEQPVTLDFPFCPSASQAQRLARRKFELLRADRGEATTTWAGLAAWGRRMVTLETEGPTLSLLCAIEPPTVDDLGNTVKLPFVVWPTLAAWNPATMEADAPDVIPEIPVDTALDTPSTPSAIEPIVYPDGSKAVRVAFSIGSSLNPELTLRTWTDGLPDPWMGTTEHAGAFDWAERAGLDVVGVKTQARVRVFNDEADSSNWSGTKTVNAPALSAVAPTAPTIEWDADNAKVRITVPNEIRIVYIVTTGNGSPGTITVPPGQVVEWVPSLSSGTNTFTVRAWTSTGLAGSSTATLDVVA